jgi:hypothetical protein
MFCVGFDTFAMVMSFIITSHNPKSHLTIGIFEVHKTMGVTMPSQVNFYNILLVYLTT